MNLKSMKIDALVDLRNNIEALLKTKLTDERRTLESQLAKLTRYGSVSRPFLTGKVAPKYRNPENPSETWAGRGLKPRWLTAATKSGKKLEDFRIVPPEGKRARRASGSPAVRKASGTHGSGGGR